MVNIDINQFNSLKKMSSKSYNDQKAVIKKVLAGRIIPCEQCKQPLAFIMATTDTESKISCQKGCTDIALNIDF